MKGFKKETKEELRTSFRRAKKSTASLGNFDKQVEGEKKEKIGGKRKYDSLFNKNEKANQMQILDLMSKKNPKLNSNAAADKVISMEPKSKQKKGAKKFGNGPLGRAKKGGKRQ